MIKILFLAANPLDTGRLRLDEEVRVIDAALRQGEFRDRFDIRSHWAARISDLQELFLRYQPDIVHFSGHGSDQSELILVDNTGNGQPISTSVLSQLFSILKDNIRCVVLNACYSKSQAQAIAEYIDCVVGMSEAISDEAALNFVTAFYRALGYGRDIWTAHELGCLQINMKNLAVANVPQLLSPNADPKKVFFGQKLTEDGQRVTRENRLDPPLPAFDAAVVRQLSVPGGAIKLRDTLYVERNADALLQAELANWGSTTTIHAPRQTGKTSLLMRGLHFASQAGIVSVLLDLQTIGSQALATVELFYREVAECICHDLHLDVGDMDQLWQASYGPQLKLTYYLEDHILSDRTEPLILAIDEADLLLHMDYYRDFFGLLRSWHNRRARDERWELLNMVLVLSTEPYLLIPDVNQSPFNVGLVLNLDDFNEAQVSYLNNRHGQPLRTDELPAFMHMFSGHPYLTRAALYTLVTEKLQWPALVEIATDERGPFGQHLRRQFQVLNNNINLRSALTQIVKTKKCVDDTALFRLQQAGLIKGSGGSYTCRCDLYQRYFAEKWV